MRFCGISADFEKGFTGLRGGICRVVILRTLKMYVEATKYPSNKRIDLRTKLAELLCNTPGISGQTYRLHGLGFWAFSGLLSNQGEKSINFYFIRVPSCSLEAQGVGLGVRSTWNPKG